MNLGADGQGIDGAARALLESLRAVQAAASLNNLPETHEVGFLLSRDLYRTLYDKSLHRESAKLSQLVSLAETSSSGCCEIRGGSQSFTALTIACLPYRS